MLKATSVLTCLFVGLIVGVAGQQPARDCGECDSSRCPAREECPGSEAMDACGCCVVCERSLGQRCDIDTSSEVLYGPCGNYLVCTTRTDILNGEEATCQCQKNGEVCGNDGVTYDTLCHLLDKANAQPNITVQQQGPCLTKPVIKSPPMSSRRHLGGILVLDCEAYGVPVPEIYWEIYKPNGRSILLPNDDSSVAVQTRGGPEAHMVTGWVQVVKMTREAAGIYVCNAKNSQGHDKAVATITYHGQENEIQH